MFNVLDCQDFMALHQARFICTVNYTYRCFIFYAVIKIKLMEPLLQNDGIITVQNVTVYKDNLQIKCFY